MIDYKCKICDEKDDEWWCCDYIFGILCQECRIKYTPRLLEVARDACDKEIEKIKEEYKNDK